MFWLETEPMTFKPRLKTHGSNSGTTRKSVHTQMQDKF